MVTTDYVRVEKAIHYLEAHFRDQPQLSEVAANIGLSEYHFQRLFRRWAGISPKRFLQFLTAEYAKTLLEQSQNTLDVTFDTGLSSPSRLHDLVVNIHAMTPGELKRQGADLRISYGTHESPFGNCLIATTAHGICALEFDHASDESEALNALRQRWQQATLEYDPTATATISQQIFTPAKNPEQTPFNLLVKGTNFQIKVWEALLKIPAGAIAAYEDVATMTGKPTATRAVGSAIAQNSIAYLIPCHRVIRKNGALGQYRWGPVRKKAMLAWEAAQVAAPIDSYAFA
ncbi:MAG: methylated-DNA--[protein]-cysteine S-methyltransferase [Gammaproteobacteria bacterium]|nr:methylated-DNA--[protein]-cysteine S-methyltransferase [Gammaproteobacteria bacterium]